MSLSSPKAKLKRRIRSSSMFNKSSSGRELFLDKTLSLMEDEEQEQSSGTISPQRRASLSSITTSIRRPSSVLADIDHALQSARMSRRLIAVSSRKHIEEPDGPIRAVDILKSKRAILTYVTIALAVYFRSTIFLNIISLVIVASYIEIIFAWCIFFFGGEDFSQALSLCSWLLNYGLDQAERTLKGDYLRRMTAGMTLKVWNNGGQRYFFYLWRQQQKQIHQTFLEQARGHMAQAERIRAQKKALFQYKIEHSKLKMKQIAASLKKKG